VKTSWISGRGTRRAASVAALGTAGFVAVVILALSASIAAATPSCTDDFTGPSGGVWSLAGNWTSVSDSSHVVPGDLDVVCLEGSIVDISSGTADADSIQAQGGGVQIDGGDLTLFSTTNSSTLGSLALDQVGELSAPPAQTVTVTGNIEWGSCTGGCDSAETIDANVNQTGGTLDIDGPGTGISGPTLSGGSISTSAPVTISNPEFDAEGTTSLTTTSSITLGSGVQLDGGSSQATFDSNGLELPSGTAGFGPSNVTLTGGSTNIGINTTLQTGTLALQGGVLDDDGGLQSAPDGTESLTIVDATLKGTGNMQGPVTNVSGTVVPGDSTPGTLTMSGSYTQDTAGHLTINIAASHFGQLQVDGAVSADGSLATSLSGFTPQSGQVWVVVTALGGLSGTFALTGPSAGAVTPVYGARSLEFEIAAGGTTSTGTTTTTTPTGTTTGTTSTPPSAATTTTASTTPSAPSGTPGCERPSGKLTATAVGPLALGLKRAAARRLIVPFTAEPDGVDSFCLYGGQGIKVGYPSAKLLRRFSRETAKLVTGTAALVMTSDAFYSLDRIHPGAKLTAAVLRRLRLGEPVLVAANSWYLTSPGRVARGAFKVRNGVVLEVGVVDRRLTSNSASQRALLRSFGSNA
jgi:hypothetical protein